MKIMELTDDSRNGCVAACVIAWYITMKKYKILLMTGESGNLWRCPGISEVPVDEIDLLFLAPGCRNSLREVEYFLKYNHKAKIYLSRANNETRLRSIYNKLIPYSGPGLEEEWEKRIAFMDGFVKIDDEVQLFTEEVAYHFYNQNMILSEGGIKVSFVNGGKQKILSEEQATGIGG